MKTKLVYILFVSIFISGLISCIAPNIIAKTVAEEITGEEQQILNNAYEHEPLSEDLLYSAPPVVSCEKLNWFTTVNDSFKKFSIVRVIDCETRKQYYVKRVGGYYHADVETLTKNDTQILKSLYGNTWSWVRRPVWVEINGIFVAGSINGMPHSYEYITDNNEDGHTCIHFYMSRTHGTNNLDESHQSCVQYAYDHGYELNEFIWN